VDSPALLTNVLLPDGGFSQLPTASVFPNQQPIEVDLGCGKGRFLIARAQATPDTNFIGIDRQFSRIQKIDKRVARAGLTNVRLLRMEALHAIQNMLPEASVRAFYIFFPDPWPKRKHHRRRLFSGQFLESLSIILTPGGLVHVMTDHGDYFQSIRTAFAANPSFAPVQFPDFPETQRTDFEILFMNQQASIGRCSFKKAQRPAERGSLSSKTA